MATLAARTSHEIKCVKKTNEPCNVKHSIPKPPVVSVKVKQEPLHRYKLISTSTRLPFKGNEKLTHWGKGKKTSFTCKVCGKWLISARNLRYAKLVHHLVKSLKIRPTKPKTFFQKSHDDPFELKTSQLWSMWNEIPFLRSNQEA